MQKRYEPPVPVASLGAVRPPLLFEEFPVGTVFPPKSTPYGKKRDRVWRPRFSDQELRFMLYRLAERERAVIIAEAVGCHKQSVRRLYYRLRQQHGLLLDCGFIQRFETGDPPRLWWVCRLCGSALAEGNEGVAHGLGHFFARSASARSGRTTRENMKSFSELKQELEEAGIDLGPDDLVVG